jgi:hypothetical protein
MPGNFGDADWLTRGASTPKRPICEIAGHVPTLDALNTLAGVNPQTLEPGSTGQFRGEASIC